MAITFDDEATTKPKVASSITFDDDTVKSKITFDDDSPTAGETVSALAAEIAVAEGLKYAGARSGAKIGGMIPRLGKAGEAIGATVGYVGGGIKGGISGSLLAQEIEGRDKVNWGRVVSDTVLNLIPGGLGKTKKIEKTADVLPVLVKGAAKRTVEGAVIASGGAQIEKAYNEGEWLTADELTNAAVVGGGLGLGLGAAGEVLKKAYPKFEGKGSKILNDAYEKGDHSAIALTETLAKENPEGRGRRWFNMLKAKVTPATSLGRRVTEETYSSLAKAKASLDTASLVRDEVNKATKGFNQNQKDAVDDYLFGQRDDLIPEAQSLKKILDGAKGKIDEYQRVISDLYDEGRIDMNDYVAAKIKRSIDRKDYKTREYKWYEDPSYKPSASSESKLRRKLARDGMSEEEISGFIQGLKDKRYQAGELMNHIAGASGGGKKVFKKRKLDNEPELREYLGEYTEVGERLFGTISRLGRIAAREAGNKRISEQVLNSKLGKVYDNIADIPDGAVPLQIGGKAQTFGDQLVTRNQKVSSYVAPDGQRFNTQAEAKKAGFSKDKLRLVTRQATKVRQPGQTIYVTEDVNEALKGFFNSTANREAPNIVADIIGKVLSSTTSAAKFVLVPLNIASYPVQWLGSGMTVASQGMNPFKGYRKGFGVAMNELNGRALRKGKYTLEEISRLKELDLLDQGVVASDIRDGFKNGILPKATSKIADRFGKAYNVFDTAQRIAVYENYKGFLEKHIPASQFDKMSVREVEEIAAELTNATYQNYGRINKSLRQLSRYGLLNEFAAFNLEMTRTIFNQARLAKSMTDGSFSDEMAERYGVNISKEAMRKEGIKRIAALTGILTAGSAGITLANREGGVDEEEEIFLREHVLPDWERNAALHIRMDGNKFKVANMSYQFPASTLTSVAEAAIRGDDFASASGNTIEALRDAFGGQLTINLRNFVSAVTNTDLKTRDTLSDARGLTKGLDLAKYYVAANFTPGTVRDIKNFDKRGGFGSIENQLRYTLGYRSRSSDIETGIGYKLRALRDNLSGVRGKYTSDLYKSNDIQGTYDARNAIYKQNLEVLVDFVDKARSFHSSNADAGLDDDKLVALMKKNGISKSDVDSAMNGEVGNMPIFAAHGASNKEERLRRYVEMGEKMPYDMLTKMLQQGFDGKKIYNADVKRIMRTIDARKVFGSN